MAMNDEQLQEAKRLLQELAEEMRESMPDRCPCRLAPVARKREWISKPIKPDVNPPVCEGWKTYDHK